MPLLLKYMKNIRLKIHSTSMHCLTVLIIYNIYNILLIIIPHHCIELKVFYMVCFIYIRREYGIYLCPS